MSDNLDRAAQLAWAQTWQVAAVVLAVSLVTRLSPVRRQPHLAYALWLLVLAKCLTPPLWASPTSPFSWALASTATPIVETPPSPTSDFEPPRDATMPEPDLPPPRVLPQPAQPLVDNGSNWIEADAIPAAPAAELPLSASPEIAGPVVTPRAWLVLTWLIGGTLYFTLSLGRYLRTRRRLIRGGNAHTERLDEIIGDLSRSLRLRRSPRAILTSQHFGPAVLGTIRPILIVPNSTAAALSSEQMRLVLAHELIHLRRGDHWMGLLQFLVQSLWWFNPLVWWANHEINRTREQCCDEAVLATLHCEPAGYAQMLLDIVRLGARSRPLVLTAGVSAMYVTGQRLQHIMSDASRFHRATPRSYWLTAALSAVFLLPGAGMALQADEPEITKPKESKADGPTAPIRFAGTVIEQSTKKPIEGARVTITWHVRKGTAYEIAGKSEHRTDSEGRYEFTPGKDVKGYDHFVIALDVEHDQYIANQGRQLGINLAEEAKRSSGVRQLEPIQAVAAETIRGTIETPVGKPAIGLPVIVYSVLGQDRPLTTFEVTNRTTTNDQGAFLAKAAQEGEVVVWIAPEDFSPLALDVGGKRGELGTYRLEKGLPLSGQVLNESGQPVVGVGVRAALKDRIVFQVAPPYGGNQMQRTDTTDSEGRFHMAALRPGNYEISIDASAQRKVRTTALGPVFPSTSFRLSGDKKSAEIRAADIVTVDVRCVDTSNRPAPGVRVSLSGDDYFQSRYQTWAVTSDDGQTSLAWPNGYRAALSVFGGNRHHLYRVKQFELPPGERDDVKLGRVDKDLRNIEIVQYNSATLIVKGENQRGELITDFKPEIRYSAGPEAMSRWVARDWRTDVSFTKLPDGRWKSENLWPLEEFTISAYGAEYQTEPQKLKLAEGEVKEVDLALAAPEATKEEESPQKPTGAENRPRDKGTGDRETPQDEAASDVDGPQAAVKEHPISVSGRALDHAGKPIQGATIYLVSTNVSENKLLGETTTDAEGGYEFRDKPLPIWSDENEGVKDQGSFEVFGKAPGRAFAWQGMKQFLLSPLLPGQAFARGPGQRTDYYPEQKIELDLTFDQPKSIAGRIVDETGRPIPDVKLHLQNCDYLDRAGRETHDNDREFWAMYQAIDIMPDLLRDATDADGRFAFESVPPNVYCRIYVEHPKYAHLSLYASTATNPPAQVDEGQPVSKLPLELTLREVKTIQVRVVSAVTGNAASNIEVTGYQNPRGASGTSDYGTTDKQGKVTLRLPPGQYKLLGDPPRKLNVGRYIRTYQQLVVAEAPPEQSITLKMDQGCLLVLKAVDVDSGKGIAGVTFWKGLEQPQGARTAARNDEGRTITDVNGELRAVVEPGKGVYGVGWGRQPPDGYRVIDADARGREVELRAGEMAVAEFKLKKTQPTKLQDGQDQKRNDGSIHQPVGRNEHNEAEQAQLTYFGRLTDHETNQPINGAEITVVRYTVDLDQREGPKTTVTSTTDANGNYQFSIPRNDLVGGRLFGVRSFQHPDYVGSAYAGFFSVPAKNATQHDLGTVQLVQGVTISGKLETPDGQPAVGVPGYALIRPGKAQTSLAGSPRHKIRTGTDGRFSFTAFRGSDVTVSFIPDRFAPVTRELPQQRGDIGRIRLSPGVRVSGTVQDLDGKPVAGAWVNFVMDEMLLRMRLRPDQVSRAALTNAQGEYQLDPIPPGRYRVMVQDRSWDDRHESEHVGDPLPAAFSTTRYTSTVDTGDEVLNVTAVPHVTLQMRFYDSSGKPTSGGPVLAEGTFRGQPYMVWGRLGPEGKVSAKVPSGLANATVMAFAQSGQSLRYRHGKDGRLEGGPRWNLGTLNEDATDLDVIVYRRPRLTLNVVDEAGKQVGNYSIRIEYTSAAIQIKPSLNVRNNEPAAVRNDEGPQAPRLPLYPGEEFTLTVDVEGYRPASQKLKLDEGETKEVELRMSKQ